VPSGTQRETRQDKIQHRDGGGISTVHKAIPNPEQIATLVRQAQQSVAVGDFHTARKLFQQASDAGNAAASLALAASYDPVVLSRLDVRVSTQT